MRQSHHCPSIQHDALRLALMTASPKTGACRDIVPVIGRLKEVFMLPALTNASAALLILKPAGQANAIQPDPSQTATDRLTAIINGISSEDSPTKTKAASKITSSLLDQQETGDGIVSRALKLFDSENVKCSDPKIKGLLKELVSGEKSEFVFFYRKELADKPRITDDNALANALHEMIFKHRDRLGDDEFILGVDFSNGGGIMWNIPDKNGNSTDKRLQKQQSELHNQIVSLLESASPADGRLSQLWTDFFDVIDARRENFEGWSLGF